MKNLTDLKHYTAFAELFRYPGENCKEVAVACQKMIDEQYPEISSELKKFTDHLITNSVYDCQSLYTKTFDVQPMCYLDLGYVIFGEDYKRGAFLLHMKDEQRKAGIDCGSELPDNISNVLLLMTHHGPNSFIRELVAKIVAPGVDKMIDEFAKARIDLKIKVLRKLHKTVIDENLNHGNLYLHAFLSLKMLLEQDFGKEINDHKLSLLKDQENNQSFFKKRNTTNHEPVLDPVEEMNLITNHKLD